ncbi:hypothetical protein ASG53_04500 [Sanguibacter sp. Leaf3]|nr:hypothetical protein ASG53_04500 [Sanguibacter sp. Leaf3]
MAQSVLEHVGGEVNVASVVHCATRLRFRLNDESKADTAALEATAGVIAVVTSGGQLQVVVGNDVPQAYAELGKIMNLGGEQAGGRAGGRRSLLSGFIDLVSTIFSPLLWALAGTGLLKALLALVGTLGWLDTQSQSYVILNAAGDGLFTFLPVLLAVTSARRFGANPFVAMAVAAALVHPSIIALDTAGTPVHFFGLPVVMVSYVSSVIPIIVAVWVQSHLEKLLDKVLPSSLRNFLTPFFVVAVLVPVTLLTIGPVTSALGSGLSDAITWLWTLSPAVGGALLGAFWQVFVIFGVHWGFVPVMINDLATNGFSVLSGPLVAAVMAQAAACIAVFVKTRNRDLRLIAGPAAVSGLLAGVTEPAIYGVTLRLKKPFVYACIAGGVGGGIASAGGSAADVFALPGLVSLSAYMNIGNFTLQVVGSGIAIVLAFLLTIFLGFEDPPETVSPGAPGRAAGAAGDASTTGVGGGPGGATGVPAPAPTSPPAAAPGGRTATLTSVTTVSSPVVGRAVPLAAVPDRVFSSGALGYGLGVVPSGGSIHAPFDGEVVSVMPHAYGVRSVDGVEVLVHVGIDTVRLEGRHFVTRVEKGQHVVRGDLLALVDLAGVTAEGFDPVTVVLVLDARPRHDVLAARPGDVDLTSTVLTVVR